MSAIPNEIPGFGSATTPPRQNPRFAPGPEMTTEDYFIFSRCDGHASARDIIVMAGLGADKTANILRKLRRLGALLLPGETPDSLAAAPVAEATSRQAAPRAPVASGTGSGQDFVAPAAQPIDIDDLSAEEALAMAEPGGLSTRERLRIIEILRVSSRGTYYDLLGVLPGTGKKELKRAYFRLSKEFHPDRYYQRDLGIFATWLNQIFESLSNAFQVLSDEGARPGYDASLRGEKPRPAAQTRGQHAAELFTQACAAEIRGDLGEAVSLFAGVLMIDAQPRYLRRAALCCLAAGDLAAAEEYANKGAQLRPDDPAYARVLAEVHKAAGRLAEAERTLLGALELKSENDVLVGELAADLAAVQAALRRGG